MTRTQPTETTSEGLDSLASTLESLARRPYSVVAADELSAAYDQHRLDDVQRWLEFSAGLDWSDRFRDRMDAQLKHLRDWQSWHVETGYEQAAPTTSDDVWVGPIPPDRIRNPDGAALAYKSVCALAIETSKWLRQLSAMIKAKSGGNFATAPPPATSPNDRPKLNATDRTAGRFIKSAGPVTAPEIAKAIHKTDGHFYKKIEPKLKPYGLQNDRNHDGYYFPDGTGVDEG